MSVYTLWLIFVVIPAISEFANLVTALSFVAGIGLYGASFLADKEREKYERATLLKISKTLAIVFCVCFPLSLLPDKEEVQFLAGGYIVTNIEGIEELPETLVGAANEFLSSFKPEEK